MRVLVTGGTGYLGRVLVAHYADRGHEVHATWHERFPDPSDGVTWHSADFADLEATRQFVQRLEPELVFHTAYRGADEVVTSHAAGIIAEASRLVGARLVHISTDVVFDGTRGDYREDDELHPVTAYGKAKADAERRVAAAHPDALIVRTSLLYGGAEAGPQELLVARSLNGDAELAFFTDEMRSVVQVDDLANALVELAADAISGPLHVAGPEPVSRHEFAWLLACSNGEDVPIESLPRGSTDDFDGVRPKDCTLDSTLAGQLLLSRLRGAREVLAPDAPTLAPES